MRKLKEKYLNPLLDVLKKIAKSRYFPIVFGFLMFITIYFSYIIFATPGPIPEITGFETASELANKFSAAASQQDFTFLQGVMAFLLLIDLGIGITMMKRKTMTPQWAVVLIFIAGFIMRIGYGIFTDGLVTRQHDLSIASTLDNGHYGITMSIFENWELPERILVDGQVDLERSYQMYHPMLTHMTWALFMHFNSLFLGSNTWVLYQSIRILSIFFSCMSLYFIYLTFKEMKVQGWTLVMATAFISFSPIFYRLSAMTNNDPMAYFFIFLSILFAAKWLHKPTLGNIVVIALAIGLGMASKLTAAMMAFPVAGVFVYRLIMSIKQKKGWSLVPGFVLFALIVFPLGLFFPIRSYLFYNQPFTYVWHNLNHHLLVVNTSIWDRYFSFPVNQLTHSLFEILWDTEPVGQDYNIYTTLMKSFLYGEFYFGNYIIAGLLMLFNIILVVTMFLSLAFFLLNFLYERKIRNKELVFFIGGIGLTFFISYIQFNLTYPYTCTMDFRYVVAITLPISLLIAYAYEKTQEKNTNPKLRHFGAVFFPWLIAAFSLTSILYYLSAA